MAIGDDATRIRHMEVTALSDENDEVEVNAAGMRIIRGGSPEANAIEENSIQYFIGVINELPEIAEGYRDSDNPRLAEAARAALAKFRAEGKWAPRPPTPWSYWVTEDRKVLAGKYPGDLDQTTAAVKLTQLVCAGVGKFVDLTEEGELRAYDTVLHKFFPEVEYVRVPVKDVTAANENQVDAALKAIAEGPGSGEVVYVHCWGGCGRTGQVLGCYLIEHGLEPTAALKEVQLLTRPLWAPRHEDCPQTVAQKQVVLDWRPRKTRFGYGTAPVRPEVAVPRIRGCFLGGAVGDAVGAGIEFKSMAQIRQRFGQAGVTGMTEAYGRIGAITDDTQMTLFTAEGLLRSTTRGWVRGIYPDVLWGADHALARWLLTQGIKSPRFSEHWTDKESGDATGPDGWLVTVPGLFQRRAPGNTCLSALQAQEPGSISRPLNDSKGCGGVMRIAPVGLIGPEMCLVDPQYFEKSVFDHGRDIAALTHGHPSGYLSAGVLADVIQGIVWHALTLHEALDHAESMLVEQAGYDETLTAVRSARKLAASDEAPSPEMIAELGAGWVAEEALAIAVYAALVSESFREGVLLAVNHGGDSDSTGAIAGNLLGAMYGFDAIPPDWLNQLELREEIEALAEDWAQFSTDHTRFIVPDGWDPENEPRWYQRYPIR
jgi:ADP-ribosyl-[dinitrogen reductase] hydrolase